MKNTPAQSVLLIILFLSTWITLITQFYVNVTSGLLPVAESVTRYFSYFTIDTNLLAALCATFLLFKPAGKASEFFSRQSVQTAIAAYIFIVGLVYNTVLRSLWSPQGLQRLLDEAEHVINPLLFIIYWALFSNKTKLPRNAFWPWLLYPLVYTVLVLIRGSLSGFYPYPFMDVTKLGFNAVLSNCIAVTLLFVITTIVFRFLGSYIAQRRNR